MHPLEFQLQNPYFNVAAIHDANMFFGRTHLLKRIYSAITNRESVSLVGPRKIGKSSILGCMCLPEIQKRLDYNLGHYLFVLRDMNEYYQKTQDDFFQELNDQLMKQSQGRLIIQPSIRKGADQFSHILDQLWRQGIYSVLLMDAFDNITRNKEFDPDFFSFLRALATRGYISYITASTATLYEVSHTNVKDSPFFNIFSLYEIGALTEEEAFELASVPASRIGLPFTSSEIDWILALAGRHPFLIQRVCSKLFEEKLARESLQIELETVKKRAYGDLLPYFEYTWTSLNERNKERLKLEASLQGMHQRNIPELSESLLFRRFVRNRYNIIPFNITFQDVEEALEKFESIRFLGESNLSHLNAVSFQYKKSPSLQSTVEIGLAVRKLLVEALEKMRGPGVRKDSAPEWRSYNILYYRYFQHHMTSEKIAAILAISIRQFFRERNKAIELLLNAIQKIEAKFTVSTDKDE